MNLAWQSNNLQILVFTKDKIAYNTNLIARLSKAVTILLDKCLKP